MEGFQFRSHPSFELHTRSSSYSQRMKYVEFHVKKRILYDWYTSIGCSMLFLLHQRTRKNNKRQHYTRPDCFFFCLSKVEILLCNQNPFHSFSMSYGIQQSFHSFFLLSFFLILSISFSLCSLFHSLSRSLPIFHTSPAASSLVLFFS